MEQHNSKCAKHLRCLLKDLEETKNAESLESFIACRLIQLHKLSGIRPIGVGEVLRIIAGKVVMILL